MKRTGKVSRDNTKARESILEDDLAKDVNLSLHNSFGLKRVQDEEAAEPSQEAAETDRVDLGLRAIEGVGRNRNQLR